MGWGSENDLRHGIQKILIPDPDPGVKKPPDPLSWLDPQHCSYLKAVLAGILQCLLYNKNIHYLKITVFCVQANQKKCWLQKTEACTQPIQLDQLSPAIKVLTLVITENLTSLCVRSPSALIFPPKIYVKFDLV